MEIVARAVARDAALSDADIAAAGGSGSIKEREDQERRRRCARLVDGMWRLLRSG